MNKKYKNKQEGFALLLALIVSSIALSIGLSILNVTLKQLTLGTTTRGSEVAFQAANAGMECLRHTRNAEALNFIDGVTVPLDCLGVNYNMANLGSGTTRRYEYATLDWTTSQGDFCIDIEIYALDASTGAVTDTLPNLGSRTCPAGDFCTYGFSRGHNRSCTDIQNSIFTVQRELTVEF